MSFPFSFPPRPQRPARPQGPASPRQPLPKWGKWTAIIVGCLVVVLILLTIASQIWTNIAWFKQLGYLRTWATQYVAGTVMFVIGFILMFAVAWLSMRFAYKQRSTTVATDTLGQSMEAARKALDPLRKFAMIGVPALMGIFAGASAASHWQTILLYVNSTPFHQTDPQFHLDISFYVFTLPFLSFLLTFVMGLIIAPTLAAVAMYFVYGAIRLGRGNGERLARPVRLHLGIAAALFALGVACSYLLDRYAAVYSTTGSNTFNGADYTTVNAHMPAWLIMSGIAVVVAVLFGIAGVRGTWKLPALGAGLMIVSAIAIGWAYPALIQHFSVTPNAQVKQTPYIQRNIDATRTAFGIAGVQTQNYSAASSASSGQLQEDATTTASIRLLDPNIVAPAFEQLQQNKQYYDFPQTLAVDRYTINGQSQDTVIAVRDLNNTGISSDSQTWVNQHTVYTHGYGVVAAYGNTTNSDGYPSFYEGDIPTTGALGTFEPDIYFGAGETNYSIVGAPQGTQPWELDYPADSAANGQVNTTYTGNGGPKLNNLFSKLAYAIKFGSTNILFSSRVNADSQILYDRNPLQRVQAVAPYLSLDQNVYPAVVNGQIDWIVDGYTTTSNYPYSQEQNLNTVTSDSLTQQSSSTGVNAMNSQNVNYMKNSVKAVVNAYTGQVTLYAWDPTDPMLQAWSKVYGTPLQPVSAISSDLMSHLRYPEGLYQMQSSLLTTYHVTNAADFYSGQGFWQLPVDPTRSDNSNQPPYYLTLKMPGQDEATFSLSNTFIPYGQGANTRNILTGFLAVDSETGNTAGKVAPDYGQLRLLTLPQSATVAGPGQVQNLFNSDANVQNQLRLLRDGGSQVVNGNLLTLPVGGGLLYVEPVYVQSSTGTQYPSLQYVLCSFAGKVGFASTLDAALNQVFNGSSGASAGDSVRPSGIGSSGSGTNGGTGTTPSATASPTSPAPSATPTPSTGSSTPTPIPTGTGSAQSQLQAALNAADQALTASQNALTQGNWSAYGQAQAQLKAAIAAAIAAQGQLGK